MTAGQLDLLPGLAADPAPHRYEPRDPRWGLGPCTGCGRHQLDEVHTHGGTGSHGVARFFDALDLHSRDRLARTRDTLDDQVADLERIAAAHVDDARFTSGVAWGIAALRLAQRAAHGDTRRVALRFPALRP